MTEDIWMDGRSHSNISNIYPDLYQSTYGDDVPTDGSGCSLNDSGPSTPIHEGEETEPTFTDTTSPLILHPYAVEEPDDEPISVNRRSESEPPTLPDYFERWQRELKDSVHNIESEPNTTTTSASTGSLRQFSTPRRGQKRKVAQPAGTTSNHCSTPSKSKHRRDEYPIPVPGLSPKRRRRRSRTTGDIGPAARKTTLYEFRETQANDSSSSEQPTTDASADTNENENAVTDEMDID